MTGFLGKYLHQLDDKGRLALPASYRRSVGEDGLILVSYQEPALLLYPASAWRTKELQMLELVERTPEAKASVLALTANALEVVPDKQGRILIPERLQRAAKLDGEALIVGRLNRIEIWNPESFEGTIQDSSAESDKHLKNIFAI